MHRSSVTISLAIALSGVLPLTPKAEVVEPAYAVVTHGALLLDERAQLQGYLPVATVVWLDGPEREIYNRREGRAERYAAVQAQSGASGLLRQDLYVAIGDRTIAVPIGPYKVRMYRQPYPPDEQPRECDVADGCIWIRTVDGQRTFNRMVIVDGWDAYSTICQKVEDILGGDQAYVDLSKIDQQEAQQTISKQQVAYDFIVRQIAFFQRP